MKKGLVTCMLLFMVHHAFSQSLNDLEVLYLKNGSIIKGIILQKDTLGNVEIYTSDGNTFSYPYANVIKIIAYTPPPPREVDPVPLKDTSMEKPKERKGLYLIVKASVLPNGLYSFYSSFGYRINSQIQLGLGTGYDSYSDIQYGVIPDYSSGQTNVHDGFVPVYLDSRFFLNKDPTAMFIFMNVGYSWLVSGGQTYSRDNAILTTQTMYNTLGGGIFGAIGFGLKFHFIKKTDMIFDIGVRIQNYSTSITTESSNIVNSRISSTMADAEKTAVTPYWSLGIIF